MATALGKSSLFTLAALGSSVWKSSFSGDAAYICACSSDETAKIWKIQQLENSSCSAVEVARLTDHVGVVRGCDFSPDSSLLSTCSWDKRILLYKTTSDLKVCLAPNQN